MNQTKIFKLSAGLLLLAILALQVVQLIDPPGKRLGYIDNVKVYENFQLKKELASQLQQFTSRQDRELDSLNLQINQLAQQLDREQPKDKDLARAELTALLNEAESKSRAFAEDRARITNEFDEQVWTQVNQFVRDFGEAEEYDYIYGLTGDGSLMHAPESEDLTNEVIVYINERYHGS